MFLGIFVTILGIVMLIFPTIIWHITESWKSEDATEPSDLYKVSIRIGGAISLFIGISLIVALNSQ